MPLTKLIDAIEDSGLLDSSEARELIEGLTKTERPATAQELADLLVSRGHLTVFQADCLVNERPVRLVLDEYKILDEIGAGGMGQVFQAIHGHMERVVALKVMHQKVMDSSAAVERFQREVRAAAKLSHPNIVHAYDAGQADGAHYLVMEFVEGTNLRELTQRKTLDVATGVNFILQAARGLQYAHSKGVIHRDIKPANLLVTPDGRIKILDMGIARTITDQAETVNMATQANLTQAGVLIGSIDFMAPEQAASANRADQRSDVYSLGCTAFFTLAGREVYQGDTILQKLFAHQGNAVPSLREERSDVPQQLDQIVRKMIAKDPGDRFQSMGEVIEILMDLLPQLPDGTISEPDFNLPSGFLARNDANVPRPEGNSNETVSPSNAPPSTCTYDGQADMELRRFIESRGSSDHFIDFDEEQEIFRKGGDLGLSASEVELVLDKMCKFDGWKRHQQIRHELRQSLAKQYGESQAISKSAFDEAVQFLVENGMRRKSAIEECLTLILDNRWRAEESEQNSWFTRKLEQFGLD